MKISKAEFQTSSARIGQCPPPTKPEYAFIGRSNVGKSSLINMLCGQKNLAKTSSRPGKTQLINHFIINDLWYLVDLPGYGYAKVSQSARGKFQKLIMDYIEKRESLINLFVLIDSRLPPQQIDLEFMEWLGEGGVAFSIVFTKADKLGTTKLQSNLADYKRKMLESWEAFPPYFVTSAEKFVGREELLSYIGELNDQFGGENLFAQ